MCGSFTTPTLQEIYEEYALTVKGDFKSQPKTFPQQIVPIIVNNGTLELRLMQWGLIPRWAKGSDIGKRTFNARAETILTKPSFRDAFKNRRCLVPAKYFYEWQKVEGQKKKVPYSIGLQDRTLFNMAGIWEEWTDKNTGEIIGSFSIITTEPNDIIRPIHNRMPVILQRDDEVKWLRPNITVPDLLHPYESGAMRLQKM